MILWLISNYAAQAAYVVGAVWFLNGLRKALWKPRVQYLEHAAAGQQTLIKIRRQQRLPPWRSLVETWLINGNEIIREGDGYVLPQPAYGTPWWEDSLWTAIRGCLIVAKARKLETEETERKLTEELERELTKKQKLDDLIAQSEAQ